MTNLDSIEEIKLIDKGNILGSIQKLPDQIIDAWDKVTSGTIPEACKLSKNVVICGMGGSALGGRIIDSLITEKAHVPIEIFTEFRLPNYVNQNTLVILSSYSGNTEETLSCAHEALERGAAIFGVTTGGKLANWVKENQIDSFIFEPLENPSNQPRMALGYSVASLLAVLGRCGFVNVIDSEVHEAVEAARNAVLTYNVEVLSATNTAKQTSNLLLGKIPVLIASEHLLGVAHAFKNQLNENSKTFAALFDIPELNHHLMEGLGYPKEAKKLLSFLFIESDYYIREVKARYPITQEIVAKQGYEISSFKPVSSRKLSQIFETLVFGSFVAFYLSMLEGVDPTPIPWVDYFKQRLV